MSDAKPDFSRLAELTSGLGLHEHLCLIYETQEEQFAAALPYLENRSGAGRKMPLHRGRELLPLRSWMLCVKAGPTSIATCAAVR